MKRFTKRALWRAGLDARQCGRQVVGMTRLTFDAPVSEWKLVYRTLHAHLADHLELMDATLLTELQQQLQAAAREDGVDVTDHSAWDAWRGNEGAPTCEERMDRRRSLN